MVVVFVCSICVFFKWEVLVALPCGPYKSGGHVEGEWHGAVNARMAPTSKLIENDLGVGGVIAEMEAISGKKNNEHLYAFLLICEATAPPNDLVAHL